MENGGSNSGWNDAAYEKRWSNFFFSLVFVLVCGGFLWLSIGNVLGFSQTARYAIGIISGLLAALGVITTGWYLKMILWKK